jgi:hypothetical protein
MIYYLKTDTEEQMWEALESRGLAKRLYDLRDDLNVQPIDDEGEWSPSGSYEWFFTGLALDIIGTIYIPTGNMIIDDDGNEYPEAEKIEGFHANLKSDIEIDTNNFPIVDAPVTPYRKWAGE